MSFDPPPVLADWSELMKFPFPLLSDETRVAGAAMETLREPGSPGEALARRTTYLIDPDGMIVRAYRVKDIEAHPDQVLADLSVVIQD